MFKPSKMADGDYYNKTDSEDLEEAEGLTLSDGNRSWVGKFRAHFDKVGELTPRQREVLRNILADPNPPKFQWDKW